MANFLCANLGFARDNINIMTDQTSQNPPTKENILRAMRALVHDARRHDSFFFYFSGIAFQIKDLNGDRVTKCICAIDYFGNGPYPNADTPGLVVEDNMHELMLRPLPSLCRLTALFDCDSATLPYLPYLYDLDGVVELFIHPDRLWFLHQKACHADIVFLSTSQDNKRGPVTGPTGAMGQGFIDCMRASNNNLTYIQLIRDLYNFMRRHGFSQRPQLSSSYKIDLNGRFVV